MIKRQQIERKVKSIFIPVTLIKKLDRLADKEQRSFSQVVIRLVEKSLAK